MGERETRKKNERQLANYRPSPHSRALQRYQRQGIKRVEPALNMIAMQSPFCTRYPIVKLLRAVAKLLLLNQMEVTLLAVGLKCCKWAIEVPAILRGGEAMGEMLCISGDCLEFRQLCLLTLVVGVAAKKALNQEIGELEEQVQRLCPTFKSIFSEWSQDHPTLFTLEPPQFNYLYTSLTNPNPRSSQDYNQMVDVILQLSQTYQASQGKKKQKLDPVAHSPKEYRFVPPPVPLIATFNHNNHSLLHEQQSERPIPPLKKEQSFNMLGNSAMGQSSMRLSGLMGSSVVGAPSLPSMHLSQPPQYFEVDLLGNDNPFMVFEAYEPANTNLGQIKKGFSTLEKEERHQQ